MSTLNITDLLRELQAGEEARAKIPQLEASNKEIYRQFDASQSHAQALELAILGYKSTISDLTTKVARLEVERDDAGFRELEASDKLATMLRFVRSISRDVDDTVRQIDPPAPEPVPQPIVPDAAVPMTEPTHYERPSDWGNFPVTDHGAERATDPTNHTVDAPATVTSSSEPVTGSPVSSNDPVPTPSSGQRDPLPTSAPTTDTQQSAAVTSSGAKPIANASVDHSSADPQAYRPFGGDAVGEAPKPTTDYPDDKRWYNKPTDMTIADWVATGGQP